MRILPDGRHRIEKRVLSEASWLTLLPHVSVCPSAPLSVLLPHRVACTSSSSLTPTLPAGCAFSLWPSLSASASAGYMVSRGSAHPDCSGLHWCPGRGCPGRGELGFSVACLSLCQPRPPSPQGILGRSHFLGDLPAFVPHSTGRGLRLRDHDLGPAFLPLRLNFSVCKMESSSPCLQVGDNVGKAASAEPGPQSTPPFRSSYSLMDPVG